MDADPTAYAAFFPIAQEQAAKTLPLFQAEIRKQATFSWDDPPLDPVMDQARHRSCRQDRNGGGS